MQVRPDPRGLALRDLDQPPQEPSRGMLVAALAEHQVDELAVAVDGPVEVAPASGDLNVGLVDVRGTAGATPALAPHLAGKQRRESRLPVAEPVRSLKILRQEWQAKAR